MPKAKLVDGKLCRLRRGKWVEIPKEWIGKFPTDKTKRQRLSHQPQKVRKIIKNYDLNTKFIKSKEPEIEI